MSQPQELQGMTDASGRLPPSLSFFPVHTGPEMYINLSTHSLTTSQTLEPLKALSLKLQYFSIFLIQNQVVIEAQKHNTVLLWDPITHTGVRGK